MAILETDIARAAAGIFGFHPGYGTTQSVLAQTASGTGIATVINNAFNEIYSQQSNALVAAVVVANLGLQGTAAASARDHVRHTLDGVAADQRGAAIAGDLAFFATLVDDPVYGTYAKDFNARVAWAVSRGEQPGSLDEGIFPATADSRIQLPSADGPIGDLTLVPPVPSTVDVVAASAANDTLAKIAALFPDSGDAVERLHVLVVVNGDNIGSIYAVTDAAGGGAGAASNVSVVLAGTIDLAGTDWTTLGPANFGLN